MLVASLAALVEHLMGESLEGLPVIPLEADVVDDASDGESVSLSADGQSLAPAVVVGVVAVANLAVVQVGVSRALGDV